MSGEISLDSNRHEQLFNDLLSQSTVEQVKVSEICLDETKIANIIKDCHSYKIKAEQLIKRSNHLNSHV